MTKEESLAAISHLSDVIGWLQHFLNTRTRDPREDREVEDMLNGLVAARETIRKAHEAQHELDRLLWQHTQAAAEARRV